MQKEKLKTKTDENISVQQTFCKFRFFQD